MLAVTGLFSLNLFFGERQSSDKLDIHAFPMTVGEWKGKEVELTEKEYQILETRNLIVREYNNTIGENIILFIVYSETNRSVFHPPEVCMQGNGMTLVDKRPEAMREGRSEFFTNKLYLQKDSLKEMVLYCYKAGSLYTDNYYLQQSYLALHQIFGRRVPGATIRVSMRLREDERATLAALKKFLAESVKIVDRLAAHSR